MDENQILPFPDCPGTATPTTKPTSTPIDTPTTKPTNTSVDNATTEPTATAVLETASQQPTPPSTSIPCPTPTTDPGPIPTTDPGQTPTSTQTQVPEQAAATGGPANPGLLQIMAGVFAIISVGLFLLIKVKGGQK